MKQRLTIALLKEAQEAVYKGAKKAHDLYDSECPTLLIRAGKTKLTAYAYLSRTKKQKLFSISAHDLTQSDLKSLRLKAEALGKQYEKVDVKLYDDRSVRTYLEDVYKKVTSDGVYKNIKRLGDGILDMKINVLRADDFEQWKREGMNRGLEQGTLREKYYALRGMLEYAKRENHISGHYIQGVNFVIDENATSAKQFSEEQLERLYTVLESCSLRDQVIVLFTLLAGARPGETLKLKKKDIDLSKGLAKVKATQTKTHLTRFLEMPPELSGLVEDYLATEYIPNPQEFLFYNPQTQEPIKKFRKQWKTIQEAALITDMRLYDLRHTYCSDLLNHTPVHIVQRLMGHRSLKTTSKYLHHFDKDRGEAVLRVSESLGYKRSGFAGK